MPGTGFKAIVRTNPQFSEKLQGGKQEVWLDRSKRGEHRRCQGGNEGPFRARAPPVNGTGAVRVLCTGAA